MGKVDARKEELLKELAKQTRLFVPDIQKRFQISESTARRLCSDLEKENKAFRILGGLQIAHAPIAEDAVEYSYERRSTEHVKEKRIIGTYAATLVQNRDIIFVTGGTTVYEFVIALRDRIRNNELSNVVVMTNSMVNAEVLSGTARVLLTGGEYRPERRDVAGYISEQTLMSSHFNKCFMGIDGIDLHDGVMAMDLDTANMDNIASEKSEHTFILADHKKFKRQSFVVFERFSKRHTVITDSGLEDDLLEKAVGIGLDLQIAPDTI